MPVSNPKLPRLKQRILLLCVVFIVSACAMQSTNIHHVVLNDEVSYVLQPIPQSLMNTGILALFKLEQQGKTNEFLMQVEMTPAHLLISAMTVEGLSLFNLDWHTTLATLNYDKKITIEPLRVLAELQFVLWPLADISPGLMQANLQLVSNNERVIVSADKVIYRISQRANISELVNLKQDYTLTITELERWNLPLDNSASKKSDH